MSIYGRCGQEVKILRMAALADVKKLDNRKADKHDKERIKLGMYIVVEDDGKERLYDYCYLRADGACHEIDKAIEAIKAKSC
jgi:hypothetical protein